MRLVLLTLIASAAVAACGPVPGSAHPAPSPRHVAPVVDPVSGVACADKVAVAFASAATPERDVDVCLDDFGRNEIGADLQAFVGNVTPYQPGAFTHGVYYGHASAGDGFDIVVYRMVGGQGELACLGLFMGDDGRVHYAAFRSAATGLCGATS